MAHSNAASAPLQSDPEFQGGWGKLPHRLPDYWQRRMSMAAWCVLTPIVRHSVGRHQPTAYLAHTRLMDETGIKSENTIKAAVKELEALRLVKVTPPRGRKGAGYTVDWAVAYQDLIPKDAVGYQDLTPLKKEDKGEEPETENPSEATVAESRASILARYDADHGDCADVRAHHFKRRNKFNDACANSPTNLAMVAASNAAHLMGVDVTETPPPECGGPGKSELLYAARSSSAVAELADRLRNLWRE